MRGAASCWKLCCAAAEASQEARRLLQPGLPAWRCACLTCLTTCVTSRHVTTLPLIIEFPISTFPARGCWGPLEGSQATSWQHHRSDHCTYRMCLSADCCSSQVMCAVFSSHRQEATFCRRAEFYWTLLQSLLTEMRAPTGTAGAPAAGTPQPAAALPLQLQRSSMTPATPAPARRDSLASMLKKQKACAPQCSCRVPQCSR